MGCLFHFMGQIMFGLELSEIIYSVSILAVCGAAAGFLAGLLGIGGGIVFVPSLYFVFMHFLNIDNGTAIVLATGTSLMCMVPTSIAAAAAQYKRGNTDMTIIKSWSFAMLLGVAAGTALSMKYGGRWLAVLFGVAMILNSLNTLLRAGAKPAFDSLPSKWIQQLIAFLIAFYSVMMGVGGGTLTVPVLNACSVPPHRSVGTSSAVSLFICVPGAVILAATAATPNFAPAGTIGHVNILGVLCIIPLSVLTAPMGVWAGKKISPVTLKRIFAVALFIISVRMLISAF